MRRWLWGVAAMALGGLTIALTGSATAPGTGARVPTRLITEQVAASTACSSASRPLMVVVGASFSAGVGAAAPSGAWTYQLASLMGWRVVVRAAPGVGFANPGPSGRGPVLRLLSDADLGRLHPQIVVVQAGHDDAAYPAAAVEAGVGAALRAIELQAPTARVVLISAFVRGERRAFRWSRPTASSRPPPGRTTPTPSC